jgi:very-short-patch-repair endonuclease
MERAMFYGAKPEMFARARRLRQKMTPAERILWERLKKNQLGVRFKPQHPMDIFIADFYCHKLKLVIEIDGEIHNIQKEYDDGRTTEMQYYDIEIIRFTNDEVINSMEKVIEKIKSKIDERKLCASTL